MYHKRISKLSKQELSDVISTSLSIKEALIKLGYCGTGNSFETIKKKILEFKISTEHFKNRVIRYERKKTEDIFVENGVNSAATRRRVLSENLIPYICEECRNTGTYMDKLLVLQLDHINGINTDNRLSNLRFLCPNCHSQTETYGKKLRS